MFDIFDVDGDGVITKHEMKSVVKDLMIILEEYNNNANALEIFQQMDQNSDDKIDRSEFVSSLMSNNTFGQDLAAKCSQLFSRHIDRSSKGRISSWVVTILSINQFYVFMLFADLWWRELDSPSQGSFVRLPVLIRLNSPEAWQWSYWAAGHVKNYQSYNNNYAPTLHAGMMTESKGHFSSEPLHSRNIVSQLSHSAKNLKMETIALLHKEP